MATTLLTRLALAAVLFTPALGLAQSTEEGKTNTPPPALAAEQKTEILDAVKDTLLNRAFVPNLDFSKWDELTEKHKESFERADTDVRFVSAVNRALREFGISHVGLRTPRATNVRRTGNPDGLMALQSQDPPAPPANKVTWATNDTAVLRIVSFARGYERAEVEKLMVEAQKAKNIIVDLRSNGGGAVSNLGHLLGLFIPSDKPVGTFINKRALQQYTIATKEEKPDVTKVAEWYTRKFRPQRSRNTELKPFEGKVAVLINRGSASASEIFAAALKDVANAKIVGSASRGAVLASVYGRLPHGYEIQYPVSDYVTIKGVRLEGNPVQPDIPASGRGTAENDPIVQAAIKALTEN